MIRIGITAGIGAGKTSVCEEFEKMGIPVYYTDKWAKWIMVNDQEVKEKLISLLGPETYQPDGLLNRKYVANIIFNDDAIEKKVQEIIKKPLSDHLDAWAKTEEEKMADCHYALIESAIFFETHTSHYVDLMVGVSVPAEIRLERAMKRDHSTKEMVLERMRKQQHDRNMGYCDFIIKNDTIENMKSQVKKLHLTLVRIAYLSLGYSTSRHIPIR